MNLQAERLATLADFLDQLMRKRFLIGNWTSFRRDPRVAFLCPTAACAIGWCPLVFPEYWEWDKYLHLYYRGKYTRCHLLGVRMFFGVEYLGSPFDALQYDKNPSPHEVAQRIRIQYDLCT